MHSLLFRMIWTALPFLFFFVVAASQFLAAHDIPLSDNASAYYEIANIILYGIIGIEYVAVALNAHWRNSLLNRWFLGILAVTLLVLLVAVLRSQVSVSFYSFWVWYVANILGYAVVVAASLGKISLEKRR